MDIMQCFIVIFLAVHKSNCSKVAISIEFSSLTTEVSSVEARALIDVNVAAVALPSVGTLAEEPAEQVDDALKYEG